MRELLFALFIRPLIVLFIGVRRVGELRLSEGQFVIVSNHASHVDTLVLLSLIPLRRLKEVRPVAAADYWTRNRLVYAIVSFLFNILPIPRRPSLHNNPLQIMERALDEGYSLIIYPEGTRSYGEGLGPFKGGVAHLIRRKPYVTIIPIFINNTWKVLPKGHFLPLPLFVDVVIGEPIRFSGKESRDEILDRLYRAVSNLRDTLA
ncbi:MAG: 1-acyl-sn-glycerol-3-phosphate acyltransferase [Thermotogae bacterium]|nr:1-acyl-sn-glycerol-3-phosphate acyltransferase [Thermotogota bacterium]